MQALRKNLGVGFVNAAKTGGIIARRTTISTKNKDAMIMVTRSSGGLPDIGPNYSKMPRKFGIYDLEKSRVDWTYNLVWSDKVPFDVDTLDVLDNDAHISNLDILKGFGLFGLVAFVWPYAMWTFLVKGKKIENVRHYSVTLTKIAHRWDYFCSTRLRLPEFSECCSRSSHHGHCEQECSWAPLNCDCRSIHV